MQRGLQKNSSYQSLRFVAFNLELIMMVPHAGMHVVGTHTHIYRAWAMCLLHPMKSSAVSTSHRTRIPLPTYACLLLPTYACLLPIMRVCFSEIKRTVPCLHLTGLRFLSPLMRVLLLPTYACPSSNYACLFFWNKKDSTLSTSHRTRIPLPTYACLLLPTYACLLPIMRVCFSEIKRTVPCLHLNGLGFLSPLMRVFFFQLCVSVFLK